MTEQKPRNPIIKRVKITVESSDTNQYGDLIVHSKEGQDYKVSNKRTQLFDVFQPDAEVVIGFASYMNKEYVAEATAAEQIVSTDTPVQKEKDHLVKEATKIAKMTPDDWAEKDRITRISIERQTALKEAVNLASLHPEQATGEKVIATAKKFEKYLAGEN